MVQGRLSGSDGAKVLQNTIFSIFVEFSGLDSLGTIRIISFLQSAYWWDFECEIMDDKVEIGRFRDIEFLDS